MEPTHPEQMQQPAPTQDDMNRALFRQHRVIEMLKDQIGSVVLANTEQAAQMEELSNELAQVRKQLATYTDPEPVED